jgi:LemA protein
MCGIFLVARYNHPSPKEVFMRFPSFFVVLLSVMLLSGCGYNAMQAQDEQIKAGWAEVLNQYQRRADLIPNLVNVVKGYAEHEQSVLTQVTEARSQVGAIKATAELVNDPAALARFQQAQAQMTSALSRLLAVAENYPNLKADGAFRDLQAQLEGTENRITVARNRYIKAVQEYNTTVRSFPSNLTAMVLGYQTKPSFEVADEKALATPPKVDFNAPAK